MDNIRLSLHTYFLFPFSINSARLMTGNEDYWVNTQHWLDGFEQWLGYCAMSDKAGMRNVLGCWERSPYTSFHMDSRAYEDMVFFHPFVRHVFFDTKNAGTDPTLALIRSYSLLLGNKQVFLTAVDSHGIPHTVNVTELRMFVFANGMGILSIGVEAQDITAKEALWINEQMRKVYPSSGRQRREGRIPSSMTLSVRQNGVTTEIVREDFSNATMVGLEPPLSAVIRRLLYFIDYDKHEYEQVLDERMIVYSYADIDQASAPPDFIRSPQYQVLLSLFLYVDNFSYTFRYDPDFIRGRMAEQVYRRWAHEGTYYGYTAYSNITLTIGYGDRGGHRLTEGFLIHRMFSTRYYLMAVIALFYRATLLMFNEKVALVSKSLYSDLQKGEYKRDNIDLAQTLRGEYLHFTNYWYFEELANKDEESEHFDLQAREYRLGEMKMEVEQELAALNGSLNEYYQTRNTSAVNRLAMLSLIFGAGAIITGFFGMNFGRRFGELFFEPSTNPLPHEVAVVVVTLFVVAALFFGIYVILVNWNDYGYILSPANRRKARRRALHDNVDLVGTPTQENPNAPPLNENPPA
jgi:CorA-like Mg2+ transporter protein